MRKSWPAKPAPESSGPSSTASHTKLWYGRILQEWGQNIPVLVDMDTSTLDPKNAAATRIQRTSKQYNEHIEQFNKNNVEGEKMDVMYNKYSHDQWDRWLFSLDDRGLPQSWQWNRPKWYEWYLTARARAQKQAEEDAKRQRLLQAEADAKQAEAGAKTQRQLQRLLQAEEIAKTARMVARAMYGGADGDSDLDTPVPEGKRRRHT